MHKMLRTTPIIAMVSLTAALMISCSEEPDRSTKHQLPPAGQPVADAAPSASTSTSTSTTPTKNIEKVKKEDRDVRVPILVYDEMDASEKLGWDKVDGPISDYKHATWPGECAAEGVPQCKETYYGQWCQDSCGNLWGVIELVTGDVCARRSDVKLCSEW